MTLRQLTYLHEVIQQSFNISNAAIALHTSQSGVSRQLQELADELGLDLFLRRGKRLTGLTEAGAEVAAVVASIMRDSQRIKQIAGFYRMGDRGVLRVVASRHVDAGRLHDAIVQTHRDMPALNLEINQEDPEVAFGMLRHGNADLGMLPEPSDHFADLAYFPLTTWHLVLVVPVGHAILDLPQLDLAAIADYPCCCFERNSRARQIVDATFEAAGFHSPISFSLESSVNILKYVDAGLGLGFVGDEAFSPARYPGLVAVDIRHLFGPVTTGLVMQGQARVSRALSAFAKILAPDLDLDASRRASVTLLALAERWRNQQRFATEA